MIFVYKDRIIQIEWSIFRGTSQVPEDFSRALVKLFLVGNYEKYAVPVTAEGGTLVAQMPQDLPDGAYSLEAIWVKNYNNLFPVRGTDTPSVGVKDIRYPIACHSSYGMMHPWDHRSNDRCLMRSRKDYVFAVTSYPGEETAVNQDGYVTIKISSAVATYGYDGLSAYEIAVMRGDFNGTEKDFLAKNIINNPDNEDLTIAKEGGYDVIKFADKEYNALNHSGLGRVYLRKNIVSSINKNILTQDMIKKTNTRYIIQYDYDLNEEEITIPEGCTLDFQGGSFSNGTINGNNTIISANLVEVFATSLNFSGDWNIENAYPEWFGAKGDGITDDTNSIKLCLSYFKKIILSNKIYKVSSTIELDSHTVTCYGEILSTIEDELSPIFDCYNTIWPNRCYISGLKITGNNNKAIGIKLHRYCTLHDCFITNCNYGIAVVGYTNNIVNTYSRLNNINVGISAGNIRDSSGKGGFEQANGCRIYGGNYDNPVTGVAIKVGNCPWTNSTEGEVEGYDTWLSGFAVDEGIIDICRYSTLHIDNIYFENSDKYITIGETGNDSRNILINNCWFNSSNYAIYLRNSIKNLVVENNEFRDIKYCWIYSISQLRPIYEKNNIVTRESILPYTYVHTGVTWDTTDNVQSNLYNYHIEKDNRNIYGKLVNNNGILKEVTTKLYSLNSDSNIDIPISSYSNYEAFLTNEEDLKHVNGGDKILIYTGSSYIEGFIRQVLYETKSLVISANTSPNTVTNIYIIKSEYTIYAGKGNSSELVNTGEYLYSTDYNSPTWKVGNSLLRPELYPASWNKQGAYNSYPTIPENTYYGYRYNITDKLGTIIWDGTQWRNEDGTLTQKVTII